MLLQIRQVRSEREQTAAFPESTHKGAKWSRRGWLLCEGSGRLSSVSLAAGRKRPSSGCNRGTEELRCLISFLSNALGLHRCVCHMVDERSWEQDQLQRVCLLGPNRQKKGTFVVWYVGSESMEGGKSVEEGREES